MLPNVSTFGFRPKGKWMWGSRRSGFVLDATETVNRLNYLNTVLMPAKIKAGLTLAGRQFMRDTVLAIPSTPIKRPGYPPTAGRDPGELRASGALFVDGKKVDDSTEYGEMAYGRYQPQGYGGTRIPWFQHEACLVVNAPYAAKQHNQFPTKTEPTAGMNFMGSKLYANGVTYIGIVAAEVKL